MGQAHSSQPVDLSTLVLQARRPECTRNQRHFTLLSAQEERQTNGLLLAAFFFLHCCDENDTTKRSFHHTYTHSPTHDVKLTTDGLHELRHKIKSRSYQNFYGCDPGKRAGGSLQTLITC